MLIASEYDVSENNLEYKSDQYSCSENKKVVKLLRGDDTLSYMYRLYIFEEAANLPHQNEEVGREGRGDARCKPSRRKKRKRRRRWRRKASACAMHGYIGYAHNTCTQRKVEGGSSCAYYIGARKGSLCYPVSAELKCIRRGNYNRVGYTRLPSIQAGSLLVDSAIPLIKWRPGEARNRLSFSRLSLFSSFSSSFDALHYGTHGLANQREDGDSLLGLYERLGHRYYLY